MRTNLRIGEIAGLAGTTTRTIRHYHAIGLILEPDRDDSGYRRYGAADLVNLIRIRRLRALGMPLEQIATHIRAGEDADVGPALSALARDIDEQIRQLNALRTQVLDLAASNAFADPADTWGQALHDHGLLANEQPLPDRERPAVELLDAFHPQGIAGVVEQASGLLSDRQRLDQLRPLIGQFRELTDDETEANALAEEIAHVIPRPENAAPPPVDVDTMEALIGDRLTPAQRHCMRRVRQLLDSAAA
jgi:DNA-binding transcriptional MerR regulator